MLCKVIRSCQHGFLNGKSCTPNLLELLDHISSMLDNGSQIDVIYMDMSKAFDKVSHRRLKHKLSQFGFGGSLLQWLSSYLTDHLQRVTGLDATSDPLPITAEVPQGSILGPALYLLYVNTLSDAIAVSHAAMFADYTNLYSEIGGLVDVDCLQAYLDRLDAWSTYSIKGKPFDVVLRQRDIEVIVFNILTWNKQALEYLACQQATWIRKNKHKIRPVHKRSQINVY